MDHQAAHDAIRSRVKAEVETPKTLKIQYDNGPSPKPGDEIWARVKIDTGESDQADIAITPRERSFGMLTFLLHAPIEKGDKDVLNLADFVKNKFKRLTAGDVTYRTPSVRPAGRDGKWWRVRVTCPFYFEDVS